MKCNAYHERQIKRHLSDYERGYLAAKGIFEEETEITVGVCFGTKGCEECSCFGDKSKCDFYPEYRKAAK